MKKAWMAMIVIIFSLFSTEAGQIPVSGTAPYPYGLDYFGEFNSSSGGINGGQFKMTNSHDGYFSSYYLNYFEMRNLVGSQTAWFDVELFITNPDRWYRLAYRIAVLGSVSEKITVYRIDDSIPGITNLIVFDQAFGYGWPSIAGSREFKRAWTNSTRLWNITGEGSIKIRFQYTVGTNVQVNNFGQNSAAIDYLVWERIPTTNDPIKLRIEQRNIYTKGPYDIGPFGESPNTAKVSWFKLASTDINRANTLKLMINTTNFFDGIGWKKWTSPPSPIRPQYVDLSQTHYNAYVHIGNKSPTYLRLEKY